MPNVNAPTRLRQRLLLTWWIALATCPLVYIATEAAAASRNFPFWDELDSAIDFLLKISASGNWRDLLSQFFVLSNEHRMVTSRIIFAVSYWMTGTVNFHVIGLLGNLFIVGACALLVYAARGVASRVRTAVVLALLVFQLEQWENFIWSGASIDHFQVVLLAVAAIFLVTRDTAAGCGWGALCAVLATFTLAHGSLAWPVGALWLWHRRAWPRLTAWLAIGAVALGGFFTGFSFNPGHHIPKVGGSSLPDIAYFWTELIGSPLTFGQRAFAVIPGVVLLAMLAVLGRRGALTRHPVPFLTALFGIGSLVLVAFGRIHAGIDSVTSRYMILAVLPWAMVLIMLLEEAATTEHPYRWLAYATPGLIALNITADVVLQVPKEAFVEVRDRAATYYKSYGRTGDGISRMYPVQERADAILASASSRGVYRLGQVSTLVDFPIVEPSSRIVYYLDELVTNDRAVMVGGWAMIPGKTSKRGHLYLVLQTENSFQVYTTLTLQRPDVAKAYKDPQWRLSGFRAVISRDRLPAQNFKIGLLIADGRRAEYIMTDSRLALGPSAANEQLATSH